MIEIGVKVVIVSREPCLIASAIGYLHCIQ